LGAAAAQPSSAFGSTRGLHGGLRPICVHQRHPLLICVESCLLWRRSLWRATRVPEIAAAREDLPGWQCRELRRRPFRFDGVGLSLLVIVIVCWEVMLSKGQEWDWLGDPFRRVQTLVVLFAVGLVGLVVWELRHPSPVVNFRPLRERNFAACCVIIFCAFAVLYASNTSLPALLQSLLGDVQK
jgi:hypothetical protein